MGKLSRRALFFTEEEEPKKETDEKETNEEETNKNHDKEREENAQI